MCLGEKLLDVYLEFYIVYTIILLLSQGEIQSPDLIEDYQGFVFDIINHDNIVVTIKT